ncbi:MAG: hypothetical protein QOG67_175 [Verrucomicrobiota bacterium]|jgi:hypothetical protein
MRVKCVSTILTVEQRETARANPLFNTDFDLTKDKQYLVFGIQFLTNSKIYGCVVLFEIEDDGGHLLSIPAALFQVTDARVSSFWKGRNLEDGGFRLWPAELNRDYFHDDFSNRREDAVLSFRELKSALEKEFGGP